MRVLVALLDMDLVGLAAGGRPWESDFSLVRFFLLTILKTRMHLAFHSSAFDKV